MEDKISGAAAAVPSAVPAAAPATADVVRATKASVKEVETEEAGGREKESSIGLDETEDDSSLFVDDKGFINGVFLTT